MLRLYNCYVWTLSYVGELLSTSWQTGLLADASAFRQMVMVELPEGVLPGHALPSSEDAAQRPNYVFKHSVLVQNALHYDYKIEVQDYIQRATLTDSYLSLLTTL